jgi:uncharacterized protein
MKKTIRFFVGGPAFHPTAEQAQAISTWLGSSYNYEMIDGVEAFDSLDQVDLLVVMGLHWMGMEAEWAGQLTYKPLSAAQKENWRRYVGSGRPVLAFHGGIASYDDWPEFGRLLGFIWDWKLTSHLCVETYEAVVGPEPHAITKDIPSFKVMDEIYVNIQVVPDLEIHVHAQTPFHGAKFPLIISGCGGRIPGAGKTLYLANGHDMRTFLAPEIRLIWQNSVKWLLET